MNSKNSKSKLIRMSHDFVDDIKNISPRSNVILQDFEGEELGGFLIEVENEYTRDIMIRHIEQRKIDGDFPFPYMVVVKKPIDPLAVNFNFMEALRAL